MWPDLLRYITARVVLALARGDELVRCADQLLNAGVYSQALGDLYSLHRWDVAWKAPPLFARALRELGGTVPQAEDAVLELLRFNVIEILEGRLTPFDGVHRFAEQEYEPLQWTDRARLFTNAAPRELIDIRYAYQELPNIAETREDLDGRVLRFAERWLTQAESSRVDPAWLDWNEATVPRIAARLREERRFGDLPILADALEEAGCLDRELLIHLRSAGPHPRTCWVAELLAGANDQ